MNLSKLADKVIETDVLIVGGGIAGCPAAAKAAEHGLNVTLLEKAKTERSGNTSCGLDEIGFYPRDGLTTRDAGALAGLRHGMVAAVGFRSRAGLDRLH